jgi:hypothetical protein
MNSLFYHHRREISHDNGIEQRQSSVAMIDEEPLTKAESKAESESNMNATVADNIRKTKWP